MGLYFRNYFQFEMNKYKSREYQLQKKYLSYSMKKILQDYEGKNKQVLLVTQNIRKVRKISSPKHLRKWSPLQNHVKDYDLPLPINHPSRKALPKMLSRHELSQHVEVVHAHKQKNRRNKNLLGRQLETIMFQDEHEYIPQRAKKTKKGEIYEQIMEKNKSEKSTYQLYSINLSDYATTSEEEPNTNPEKEPKNLLPKLPYQKVRFSFSPKFPSRPYKGATSKQLSTIPYHRKGDRYIHFQKHQALNFAPWQSDIYHEQLKTLLKSQQL